MALQKSIMALTLRPVCIWLKDLIFEEQVLYNKILRVEIVERAMT